MTSLSIIGAFIVTLSLLSYGIGCFSLQRFKSVSPGVLWFLSLGVFLDIVATVFMIIGSKSPGFTLHGLLGYSALLVMLIDVVFVWSEYIKDKHTFVGKGLLIYSKIAYGYWVIAYLTGSLLIIWR